jgi:hypothetical protein
MSIGALPSSSVSCASSAAASAASSMPKRKREQGSSAATSASIVPIQSTALNILSFLAHRQIVSRPYLSFLRSQSEIQSQIMTKHLLNKTFHVTKMDTAPMTFASNHTVGGVLKIVIVGCIQNDLFQNLSIVKVFNLSQLKLENEALVEGLILKVLHVTNQFITAIAYLNGPPFHSSIVTYDLRSSHLIKSVDANLVNTMHICRIGMKFFFIKYGRAQLVEFDESREEQLMEIDSQVIVYPRLDREDRALKRFIFLSSDSYIIRAARLEMAITDLKDLTRNIKVNINHLIESYFESIEADSAVAKRRRPALSEVQAHAASSSGSPAAQKYRAITAAHLDGHLLYFGISTPHEEIEIGLIDLSLKKIVKMYSFAHNFADRINQVFVTPDHSWLCFGDKLGQIGIVDLKTGLSSYLGRHSTTPMPPDSWDFNGVSHFDSQEEFLISRGEEDFKIWNLKTQTELLKKESPMNLSSKPFFYEGSLYFHEFGTGGTATIIKFDLLRSSIQEETPIC